MWLAFTNDGPAFGFIFATIFFAGLVLVLPFWYGDVAYEQSDEKDEEL